MKHHAMVVLLVVWLAMAAGPVRAGMPPIPGTRQDPAVAAAHAPGRASMQTIQIPSHGELMNALVYVAAGAGPHRR